MLETSWLWFVISKEYVELTRPKIESRDPIFFTGTRSRSRVSGNDRLFPRGSEFGPNLEIPAGPAIQLRPGPDHHSNWTPGLPPHTHTQNIKMTVSIIRKYEHEVSIHKKSKLQKHLYKCVNRANAQNMHGILSMTRWQLSTSAGKNTWVLIYFFTFGPPADGREAPVGRLSRMYL